MKAAQLNLQMLEVVYSVLCTKLNMVQNAELLDVSIKNLLEYRHVDNTKLIGPDTIQVLLSKRCQDFKEWSGGLVKPYHGSWLQHQILNVMMRTCQKFDIQIISLHADFIVLKLFVHHVGL
jgi:hypothetical protein